MLSRRSLFSFLAGVGAAITGAKVVEASPQIGVDLAAGPDSTQSYLFRVMKEYGEAEAAHTHRFTEHFERMSRHFADAKGIEIRPAPQGYMARGTIAQGGSENLISNGVKWLSLDSDEGQRILMESAVNVRADGSIRHRQHHPVDFPKR